MEFSLPTRLDNVINDIGAGAIIKNLVDDRLAVVVNCGEFLIVCCYQCEDGIEPTFNVENFVIEEIGNYKEWLALTMGYDYDISDNYNVKDLGNFKSNKKGK